LHAIFHSVNAEAEDHRRRAPLFALGSLKPGKEKVA
jgi:hypothetical protein